MNFLKFGVDFPDGKSARQVGDVAVEGRAPVKQEQIASLNFALARRGMRVSAGRPAANDWRKGHFGLRAVSQQLDNQFVGKFLFAHANFDERECGFQGVLGNFHSLTHFGDFIRVLANAQVGERRIGRDKVRPRRTVFKQAQFQHAQSTRFDANGAPEQIQAV